MHGWLNKTGFWSDLSYSLLLVRKHLLSKGRTHRSLGYEYYTFFAKPDEGIFGLMDSHGEGESTVATGTFLWPKTTKETDSCTGERLERKEMNVDPPMTLPHRKKAQGLNLFVGQNLKLAKPR